MSPSNEPRAETSSTTQRERLVRLALRGVVGALFVMAGASKLLAHAEATRVLATHGLPEASLLASIVGAAELLGGLLLISAWKVRWVSAGLAAFVVAAALLVHEPVTLAGPRAFEFGVDACVVLALYAVGSKHRFI